MNWNEFRIASAELATEGEDRFEKTSLILLGSLRKDGSPRISPVEPLIVDGELYLGMMWQSMKALDLLRDPRCTVHSTTLDRHNKDGDFKIFGRALDEQDLKRRDVYCQALFEKIKWRPEEPNFHLFSIDVETAALVSSEAEALAVRTWRAEDPTRVDVRKLTM